VKGWRTGIRRAALLLVVFALVVSTWTVYNLARWNRVVIAGEGFAAFLYIGAAGWDDPEALDERLEREGGGDPGQDQRDYLGAAETYVSSDPLGYITRRVGELAGAYLQPHGTVLFPGESLRELALRWWRDDRSIGGLSALTQGDAFVIKLALYVVHYGGLLAGAAGMWMTRRDWRLTLPLIGYVAYTTLVHLFLLALPRYLFPTMIVWWVFAGVALSRWKIRL
jgi:hypothetical protein